MTTRVIIVRHGQSSFNALQKIQGRSDLSVLTEKGRQDAISLGKSLAQIKIDALYCSPLQRAKMTAEVIQAQLENSTTLQLSEQLLEVNLPIWENLTKSEVKQDFPSEYRIWKEQPENFKIDIAGEEYYPILALYKQAQDFWNYLLDKHQGQTVLVVGHNGINRCLIMSASGMPASSYHRIQQSNCSINILNFPGTLTEGVQFESINQTAHLDIPIPPPRSPKGGVRLLLVRHGETQWNRDSRFQGVRDIPLNENGRAQAAKTAEFLKEVKLDFAITSPLQRPKETAEIILQYHPNLNLEYRSELIEICHGLWEGKLEKEIEKDWTGLLKQWKIAPETVQMPEGENLDQVSVRAVTCWEDIVNKYIISSSQLVTGLIVAHDAINKVILCHILGLTPAKIWSIKQGNGAVTVIDYLQGENNIPVLQALNITSHLSSGILDKTAAGAL